MSPPLPFWEKSLNPPYTNYPKTMLSLIKIDRQVIPTQNISNHRPFKALNPMRHWLNQLKIDNAKIAHLICQVIPTQCPFERKISLFGYTIHIPPLCKLNPLYEELIGLRFRALCYLADECQEDIRNYC